MTSPIGLSMAGRICAQLVRVAEIGQHVVAEYLRRQHCSFFTGSSEMSICSADHLAADHLAFG